MFLLAYSASGVTAILLCPCFYRHFTVPLFLPPFYCTPVFTAILLCPCFLPPFYCAPVFTTILLCPCFYHHFTVPLFLPPFYCAPVFTTILLCPCFYHHFTVPLFLPPFYSPFFPDKLEYNICYYCWNFIWEYIKYLTILGSASRSGRK